eukprot:599863-Hanusia_phi.AAC.1
MGLIKVPAGSRDVPYGGCGGRAGAAAAQGPARPEYRTVRSGPAAVSGGAIMRPPPRPRRGGPAG